MGSSAGPEGASDNNDLLLQTSETVMQIAEFAGIKAEQRETQFFYSGIGAHCIRLRDCVQRAREARSRFDRKLVDSALGQLGDLVTEIALEQLLPHAITITLEFRLKQLSICWSEIRQRDDGVKLQFIGQWLQPPARKPGRYRTVLRALESCADDLCKQLTGGGAEDSVEISTEASRETPLPLDIGELSYGVYTAAQSIFAALLDYYKICSCSIQHDLGAKFEVGTYRRPRMGGLFNIFLSKEQAWEEFRVTISSRPRASKLELEQLTSLCDTIQEMSQMHVQYMLLNLTGGKLLAMGCDKSDFMIDRDAEPISLSQCLKERRSYFTDRTKRILSLILGYMVLHLNGTSWLPRRWSSANIKFFQTKSPETHRGETPLRPFLQAQLQETASFSTAIPDSRHLKSMYRNISDESHPCPALVDLVVVLMEVHFAEPFEELAKRGSIQLTRSPSGCTTLADVKDVFYGTRKTGTGGRRSEIPKDSYLHNVVGKALNSALWQTENGEALDSVVLKSRIYQYVVRPLEVDLARGYRNIRLDDVDEYAMSLDLGNWGGEIDVLPLIKAPARASRPQVDYTAKQLFDYKEDKRDSPIHKYRAWKAHYKDVYAEFYGNCRSRGPPQMPVKIAVLDTGIDQQHDRIRARKERLKGKYDFCNEAVKDMSDRNGHGTFTVSLLLDYAPGAELYVVKVADMEDSKLNAQTVANAINYAVDTWNVDIISMSFGWPSLDSTNEGYDVVEAALRKAYNNKVLMFAAASNHGGGQDRAYPASSPHVICVHSTTAYGKKSEFSPTAHPDAINIATVGESVESAWPKDLCPRDGSGMSDPERCLVSRSGTSYATAILAGIAAFLLQYVRLHLPKHAEALKQKHKMEALLKRCAKLGDEYRTGDDYYFVYLGLYANRLFSGKFKDVNDAVMYEIDKVLR